MKSNFRFSNYKVDTMALEVANTLSVLSTRSFDGKWNIEFALRIPQYFQEAKCYIAGVECSMSYPPLEGEDPETPAVQIRGGITGLFQMPEGRIQPEEFEIKMVKTHFPTLVLPYLRAAMSSCLASAGIGIHVFPLINLHDVAAKTLEGEQIIIND